MHDVIFKEDLMVDSDDEEVISLISSKPVKLLILSRCFWFGFIVVIWRLFIYLVLVLVLVV